MMTIGDELKAHPFFESLDDNILGVVAGCGENAVYQPGEYLAREGEQADEFFVIRKGRVSLELNSLERGLQQIETLDAGDVLGWSWIVPPYRWQQNARAVQVIRAIRIDGKCLRGKCDADPALGYELMKRFTQLLSRRLEANRLQLLDLYGRETL